MNIDHLKMFIDIVNLGSFSEVAKKMSISQPAVSLQVQKLEQDLGVRLLDRHQKSLILTEAGKRLLQFAKTVDAEYGVLMQDLQRLREDVAGDLVISASTVPGDFILPPLLSEFKNLHPAANIKMAVSDSARVISEVRDGAYDIGFCGTSPGEEELEAFKIAEDEIVLIVFPEHPFAARDKVPFTEVAAEPCIFREDTSGTQRSLKSLLHQSGFDISKCKPALVLGTTEAVVSTVEAKSGIAFVSSLAIKKSVSLGLVKVVPVEGLTAGRDFFCIYRKQRVVSRLLEEFISFVRVKTG